MTQSGHPRVPHRSGRKQYSKEAVELQRLFDKNFSLISQVLVNHLRDAGA